MTKQIQKADKLIVSATSIFGKALAKVMKANNLLEENIEKQLQLNTNDGVKIDKINDKIGDRSDNISHSVDLIKKNNELAEKLKQFV